MDLLKHLIKLIMSYSLQKYPQSTICLRQNLDFVLEQLEQQSSVALKWFEGDYMSVNSGKCHPFVPSNQCEHIWANTVFPQISTAL